VCYLVVESLPEMVNFSVQQLKESRREELKVLNVWLFWGTWGLEMKIHLSICLMVSSSTWSTKSLV